MRSNITRMAVCPLCGRVYHGAPALFQRGQRNAHLSGLRHQAGAPVYRRGTVRAGADHRDDSPPHAGVRYTI